MLRGWNRNGTEILLVEWQEKAVRELLTAWTAERAPQLPQVGRQGGKTVVMLTAAKYEYHWDEGHPLPDDPRLTMREDDHDEHLLAPARAADHGGGHSSQPGPDAGPAIPGVPAAEEDGSAA